MRKLTKERINQLLNDFDTVCPIFDDTAYIKCYYVSNVSNEENFDFDTSSLQFAPLDGWCFDLEQLLHKSFKHVHKAVYKQSGCDFYPPYIMYNEVKYHNIDTALIAFS